MDIKDFLLQNENSLPTIDGSGSPSTSSGAGTAISMKPGELPAVTASSMTYWKFGVSSIVGLLGMYYLASGKKNNDVQKMLIGAALTLGSMFMY